MTTCRPVCLFHRMLLGALVLFVAASAFCSVAASAAAQDRSASAPVTAAP